MAISNECVCFFLTQRGWFNGGRARLEGNSNLFILSMAILLVRTVMMMMMLMVMMMLIMMMMIKTFI